MQLGIASESDFAPWDPPRTNIVLGHGPGSKYWELSFFNIFFLTGLPVFTLFFGFKCKVFEK